MKERNTVNELVESIERIQKQLHDFLSNEALDEKPLQQLLQLNEDVIQVLNFAKSFKWRRKEDLYPRSRTLRPKSRNSLDPQSKNSLAPPPPSSLPRSRRSSLSSMTPMLYPDIHHSQMLYPPSPSELPPPQSPQSESWRFVSFGPSTPSAPLTPSIPSTLSAPLTHSTLSTPSAPPSENLINFDDFDFVSPTPLPSIASPSSTAPSSSPIIPFPSSLGSSSPEMDQKPNPNFSSNLFSAEPSYCPLPSYHSPHSFQPPSQNGSQSNGISHQSPNPFDLDSPNPFVSSFPSVPSSNPFQANTNPFASPNAQQL